MPPEYSVPFGRKRPNAFASPRRTYRLRRARCLVIDSRAPIPSGGCPYPWSRVLWVTVARTVCSAIWPRRWHCAGSASAMCGMLNRYLLVRCRQGLANDTAFVATGSSLTDRLPTPGIHHALRAACAQHFKKAWDLGLLLMGRRR